MMLMHTSGSKDIPLAALLFFEDGSMALSAPDCPESEKSSLLLVSDFFAYALTRDDWMSLYIHNIKQEHKQTLKRKIKKFKVIQGGLTGSVEHHKR